MNLIEFGDNRDIMRRWAVQGIKAQTCVTSPPYFGLRDYVVSPSAWPEITFSLMPGMPPVTIPAMECCLGLEPDPMSYIGHLVEIFRCVRDVLADDGTLWLNIGDSYAGGGNGARDSARWPKQSRNAGSSAIHAKKKTGLKFKELIGIPWMLAFALRADGWYLRQDIIWHKPNPMPESVRDRCTKAHEYLFLLTKSARYFYDHEAIKEPATGGIAGNVRPVKGVGDGGKDDKHRTKGGLHKYAERKRNARDNFRREGSKREQAIPGQSVGTHRPDRPDSEYDTETRNRRSVWTIATRPYRGAHFATFPPKLVEPCVLAGSRPGDIVLDPFIGSGTTAAVAIEHGRQYLGCEIGEENKPLQQERIAKATPPVAEPDPQQDLFAEVA